MIRTQIQLSEAQAHRLHVIAKREHISVAEVVRRCIDNSLADSDIELNARYQQAKGLVGRFTDKAGARDISSRHDDYLDEAFG